ncbi:MAG TPA: hypothetical protein VMU95_19385, partial [Trebonia sp.]|nr:hypothetical protein [Trebonia sp.]
LPLVQVREDRLELRRQNPRYLSLVAHTTAACRKSVTYGLFSGKPLAGLAGCQAFWWVSMWLQMAAGLR